jgi:hypothetical protein
MDLPDEQMEGSVWHQVTFSWYLLERHISISNFKLDLVSFRTIYLSTTLCRIKANIESYNNHIVTTTSGWKQREA